MDNRLLEERLINFVVLAADAIDRLPESRVGNHLASQLTRSSISPALNYGEARGSESTKDFIHKLGIVVKELRESYNALRILSKLNCLTSDHPSIKECDELISIFVKSIQTARKNLSDSESTK